LWIESDSEADNTKFKKAEYGLLGRSGFVVVFMVVVRRLLGIDGGALGMRRFLAGGPHLITTISSSTSPDATPSSASDSIESLRLTRVRGTFLRFFFAGSCLGTIFLFFLLGSGVSADSYTSDNSLTTSASFRFEVEG
jgi:hypothetical protein